MPRGEPRSVPDPEGELYDDWVRRNREAERRALEQTSSNLWAGSPAQLESRDAASATPGNLLGVKLLPVLGPAFNAYVDVRTNKPLSVAEDAVEGLVDIGALITGYGVADAVAKGVADNVGVRTANAARKQLRRRGVAGKGQEIHHSVALNGIGRNVENWRNHPALLKVLKTADHRRLTGSWQGLPRFDPVRRVWIGTPTWMKTVPAWVTVHGASFGAPIASALLDRRSNPSLPPLI